MTGAEVHLVGTKTSEGCTACGTQATVQLHPHHGRRCSQHATVPPGPFQRELAADMVDFGRADAALSYLGVWLARRIDDQFTLVKAVHGPRPQRRCFCGRPIRDDDAIECAEHDNPPVVPR